MSRPNYYQEFLKLIPEDTPHYTSEGNYTIKRGNTGYRVYPCPSGKNNISLGRLNSIGGMEAHIVFNNFQDYFEDWKKPTIEEWEAFCLEFNL